MVIEGTVAANMFYGVGGESRRVFPVMAAEVGGKLCSAGSRPGEQSAPVVAELIQTYCCSVLVTI